MKWVNFLHRYFPAYLLLFALALVGCKDKYSDCTEGDYNNCNTERPVSGVVTVLLTINSENKDVLLRMYEGNWEDGKLVYEQNHIVTRAYVTLDVEKHYSATALYMQGSDTILAIDGGRIKLSSYRACELTCYELKEPELDLRID